MVSHLKKDISPWHSPSSIRQAIRKPSWYIWHKPMCGTSSFGGSLSRYFLLPWSSHGL